MDTLELIHYMTLWVLVVEYRQRLSRDLISTRTNKLPPRLWCKFADASIVMNLWQNNFPISLKDEAFLNTFKKARFPRLIFGFDSSKLKVGRQQTKNWHESVLSQLKVPWTNLTLSKDRIRVILNSTFYLYNFVTFINY